MIKEEKKKGIPGGAKSHKIYRERENRISRKKKLVYLLLHDDPHKRNIETLRN